MLVHKLPRVSGQTAYQLSVVQNKHLQNSNWGHIIKLKYIKFVIISQKNFNKTRWLQSSSGEERSRKRSEERSWKSKTLNGSKRLKVQKYNPKRIKSKDNFWFFFSYEILPPWAALWLQLRSALPWRYVLLLTSALPRTAAVAATTTAIDYRDNLTHVVQQESTNFCMFCKIVNTILLIAWFYLNKASARLQHVGFRRILNYLEKKTWDFNVKSVTKRLFRPIIRK